MKKAIIFDLDGVLCFTDRYHYAAWKTLADKLGVCFDETINSRLRGVSRMDSLNIILENSKTCYTVEEKEKLAAYKNRVYTELILEMTERDLAKDAKKTLIELRSMGYKLAIGSSSKNTPIILHKLNLEKYFDAVSDGNNIQKSKPDPEVFLKAAEFLNVNPNDCVVVEDAASGVEAAHRAGMTAIALGDASEKLLGDININELSEIIKCIKKPRREK